MNQDFQKFRRCSCHVIRESPNRFDFLLNSVNCTLSLSHLDTCILYRRKLRGMSSSDWSGRWLVVTSCQARSCSVDPVSSFHTHTFLSSILSLHLILSNTIRILSNQPFTTESVYRLITCSGVRVWERPSVTLFLIGKQTSFDDRFGPNCRFPPISLSYSFHVSCTQLSTWYYDR